MVEDVLIAYNDSSAETSRRFFQDCADRVRQKTCEKGLNHQMIDRTYRETAEPMLGTFYFLCVFTRFENIFIQRCRR